MSDADISSTPDLAVPSTAAPTDRTLRFARPVRIIVIAGALFAWLVFLAEPNMARLFAVFLTPPIAALLLWIWWLLSPARTRDKTVSALAIVAAALVLAAASEKITRPFALLWGIPTCTALAMLAFALFRQRSATWIGGVLGLVPWLFIRSTGQIGDGMMSFGPRWRVPDADITRVVTPPSASHPALSRAPLVAGPSDWTGFRGPQRDSVVRAADCVPSAEGLASGKIVWRHPIGAGWSSFAVVGDLAFTQEQRGESECITAYDITTGAERWLHADATRFDDISGGPGPRATPSFADGRIVAFGPSGLLTCLDAATGRVIWQHRGYHESIKAPNWGFAASPLIVNDLVIAGLCGKGSIRLAAHRLADGAPVWTARGGDSGFSSPQLATLDGVPQILYLDGAGLTGHEIETGRELWRLEWKTDQPKVAQPAILDEHSIVIGMAYGVGLRRVDVRRDAGGAWQVRGTWASNRLKPKFNDFVCAGDYAYGLDESQLACVDLRTGERVWKGGRYGYGQVLLAPPLLIILSEAGELLAVPASPEPPRELARLEVLHGKTWTHPVATRWGLLVRNDEELALVRGGP